jgi:hypothetical protein
MTTMNDLCELLDISPLSENRICFGHGNSPLRCVKALGNASRVEARSKLNSISNCLRHDIVDRKILKRELKHTASLFHCEKHQFQAASQARSWPQTLSDYLDEIDRERCRQRNPPSRRSIDATRSSPTNGRVSRNRTLRDVSDKDLLAELTHRLQSRPHIAKALRKILCRARRTWSGEDEKLDGQGSCEESCSERDSGSEEDSHSEKEPEDKSCPGSESGSEAETATDEESGDSCDDDPVDEPPVITRNRPSDRNRHVDIRTSRSKVNTGRGHRSAAPSSSTSSIPSFRRGQRRSAAPSSPSSDWSNITSHQLR